MSAIVPQPREDEMVPAHRRIGAFVCCWRCGPDSEPLYPISLTHSSRLFAQIESTIVLRCVTCGLRYEVSNY